MKSKVSFTKREILFYILLFITIITMQRFYCFASVSGSSMLPTFEDNDYLFVSKVSNIDYGDIVIVKKDGYKDYFIKRVIAKSNDSIKLTGSMIYLNNKLISEDYVNNTEDIDYTEYFETVANDSYFVLGDNRKHSGDSRVFGDVSKSEIIGVVKVNLSVFGISQTEIRVCLVLSMTAFILMYFKLRYKK